MTKGIVYILTNEAMKGYTKIGMTTSSIEQRMRDLYSTGVPLPFECYYAATVANMKEVERAFHDAFDDHRVTRKREFFEIAPERVRAVLKLLAIDEVTPRSEIVDSEEELQALNRARKRRSRFNFRMVGLEPGTILNHVRKPEATCKVVDQSKIEFEGEITSLSNAGLKVFHELGFSWVAVSGPEAWTYEGETMDERRTRLEDESYEE